MLSRALEVVERVVVDRPRATLLVALALTLLAAWQGAGIEMRTARRDLVADVDGPQRRYDALTDELGEIQPVIVVLERDDPAVDVAAAAERLARRIERAPEVARVVYRIDPDWVIRIAPWLADPDLLRAAVEQVGALLGGAGNGPIRLAGLADANERLAERLESAVAEGAALPGEADTRQAERLAEAMETQAELLADPDAAVPDPDATILRAAGREAGFDVLDNGVYADDSGNRAFLFVVGSSTDPDLAGERALVGAVREAADELANGTPGLGYGLTGRPAMTVEEMDTIARDGRRTSAIALLGVVSLSAAAFHWRRHALLGLIVLGVGVIWALGGLALQIGYLNMITTAMIPILIGLGIDYAVHPISEYEIERLGAGSRAQAVRRTFRKTAPAVVVSALTTAAAFACFLFMEFRGFAELGQAASVGVLLCLAAALLVLPALLALLGRRPEPGAEPRALVDRIWSEPFIDRICRRSGAIIVVFALVSLAAVAGGRAVELRSSLLELLPPTAESLRYLERVDESAFGTYFNVVLAGDLEELRTLAERAEGHPEIRRFDSAARLVPEPGPDRRGAVAALETLLERLELRPADPDDPDSLPAALRRVEAALAQAADAAFMTGLGELAGPLERARAAAERAADSVAGGPTGEQRAREAMLIERAAGLRERLLAAARTGAPTLDQLPEEMRSRFVTASGRYAGYAYASESIFDPDYLSRFNDASRSLDPGAVGWPMLFEAHSEGITDGFRPALAAGALAVLALLVLALRRFSHVALALVPVVAGLLWMVGAMGLLGISFNFANMVAVPLVIGVGIDAGVHVMHRYRTEGARGIRIVMAHTGRAVLIASLTTMIGFGSLMLAQHRGMAGLGTLLLLGVGASLVAALLVLPALLLVTGLAER